MPLAKVEVSNRDVPEGSLFGCVPAKQGQRVSHKNQKPFNWRCAAIATRPKFVFDECEPDVIIARSTEPNSRRDRYLGLAEQEFGEFDKENISTEISVMVRL